jgi:TP901 family phage tail tape measure protein
MAEEQIVTRIVATSDFSNLIVDLNKVSSALTNLQTKLNATNKNLSAQVAVMNRSFAETLRSTGQFSTHFVNLTSDVDKFGSQLDKGQIKLRQFFQVYQSHLKTNGGLIRQLAQQQVQLQNAVLQPLGKNAEGLMQYNVHIPTGLDKVKSKTALARQELQIMNRVVQEGANSLINWGKNTQWAGRQLTVGLTIPLAAFGKASADAFRAADQELTRLTKVYGGLAATSAAELAKVRQDVTATATELSKAYGSSFKETLALGADIAATGKQGNELLGSIKETTRLAVLGEVDRQDAMKATLAIQSAFKSNTDQLAESINFLNAVENQTSTTLNDLVEAIPKAGPIIKGLGGDVQDLALYLTAMREGGISASEGANALKSGLASLINPTKVATEMFAGFGIDLKGIVQKNAGDTTKTILALQAALDTLNPLQKQQAIEQLFGKFQFSRMNALFENLGKQGSQTLQVMDLMNASAADLANIAGRELSMVTESASGKYRRALEGLKADLAGVGEQFLTINTHLINMVDGILQFVNKLPGPIKSILSLFGGLTAVAGPLIMLTGVLGNFFGYIIKGVSHFRALFKGGEGWRLLTPEILAANKAGALAETTFYSDAKAADILNQAITRLSASYTKLAADANNAIIATNPGVSTVGGTPLVLSKQERIANPAHPLIGKIDERAAAHSRPRGRMTKSQRDAQTIHSVTPNPILVNQKIGQAPQIFTYQNMPDIPGLTTQGGVSTGIVAGEAAKWHSLMAALSMQTKQEVATLKKEISTTGTVSQEFLTSYSTILPAMTRVIDNAVLESQAIVRQTMAGKMRVDQAQAEIIRINAQLEQAMIQTTTQTAQQMGRTANLTAVPLLNQPIVDKSGKSNLRELFRSGRPVKRMLDAIARATGVKTWGGGYSIETTNPKRMNRGSIVPGTGNTDSVPAVLTPGEFVVNKEATAANLPLLTAINEGYGKGGPNFNDGGLSDLQSAHLMRSYQLLEDPAIQKALVAAGQDPKRLTSLTFQGFGQGTTAAIPRNINNLMAMAWDGSSAERSIRIAENMKLPRHLRGDIIPLTNSDAQRVSKFYKAIGIPAVASFFDRKDYQSDLIKRIAVASAKARGVSSTKDFNLFYQEELAKTTKAFNQGATHQAITRGLINEFIVDPKTSEFRPDALKKAYVTNVSRQRVRVRTGQSVPYSINRGSEEYSARQAARYGGGRWSNLLPLTTKLFGGRLRMNSGGLVPGYQDGGPVKPSMLGGIGQNLGYMGAMMGGATLGGQFGGTMGSIAGSILAPAVFTSLTQKISAVNKQGMASAGIFSRLGPIISNPYVMAGAAVIGVTAGLMKLKSRVEEFSRINRLAFSGGVKPIKDFDSELKQVIKNIEDTRATAELLHAQMNSAGISGLTLTIKQFADLREKVKSTHPELVKLFNQTPSDKLSQVAEGLKAQFVAAGDSAAKANAKIAALLAESGKAGFIQVVLGGQGLAGITDAKTAIDSMLKSMSRFKDAKDRAAGMLQIFTSMGDYIGNAKDKSAALKEQFDAIGKSNQANVKLTEQQINEIAKTNPMLAAILSTSDDIGTALAKWRLSLAGVQRDLNGLTNQQLKDFAAASEAIGAYYNKLLDVSSKEAQSNIMTGKLAKDIDAFNKKQHSAGKITVQNLQDQIDLKNKQIDQIKKEGEARKKALRDQQQIEDVKLQIQQEQLNYQIALASGDMASAAQAQINIQRLVGQQQLKAAEDAIDAAVQAKIDALQAQIDVLNKKSTAASNAAANNKPKESPYASTYQQIQGVYKEFSLGNIDEKEAMKRLNDLIRQLEQTPGGKKYLADLGVTGSAGNLVREDRETRRTDIDPNTTQGAALLKALQKGSDNLVVNAIGKSNQYLKDILAAIKNEGVNLDAGKTESDKSYDSVSGKTAAGGLNTTGTAKVYDAKTLNAAAGKAFNDRNSASAAGVGKSYRLFSFGGKTYAVSTVDGLIYEFDTNKNTTSKSNVGVATLALGGMVKRYSSAGYVSGPGTGTSDSIPAMLSNGEYVIRAAAVKSIGTPTLDRINKMAMGGLATKYNIPRMSMGGRVNMNQAGLASTSNSLYNINVTLNGSNLSPDDVAKAIEARMRMIETKEGRNRLFV